MKPVTVTLPLALTADMLRAVRLHPTTSTEDKEEEHRRIGWLLCAWDVIVAQRETPADGVVVPLEALQWLMGERPRTREEVEAMGFVLSVTNPKTPNAEVTGLGRNRSNDDRPSNAGQGPVD